MRGSYVLETVASEPNLRSFHGRDSARASPESPCWLVVSFESVFPLSDPRKRASRCRTAQGERSGLPGGQGTSPCPATSCSHFTRRLKKASEIKWEYTETKRPLQNEHKLNTRGPPSPTYATTTKGQGQGRPLSKGKITAAENVLSGRLGVGCLEGVLLKGTR